MSNAKLKLAEIIKSKDVVTKRNFELRLSFDNDRFAALEIRRDDTVDDIGRKLMSFGNELVILENKENYRN